VGTDEVFFRVVLKEGKVPLVHFLSLISAEEYGDGIPKIYAIQREMPKERFHDLFFLTHLNFASNTLLIGTSREDFESHATTLPPSSLKIMN